MRCVFTAEIVSDSSHYDAAHTIALQQQHHFFTLQGYRCRSLLSGVEWSSRCKADCRLGMPTDLSALSGLLMCYVSVSCIVLLTHRWTRTTQ